MHNTISQSLAFTKGRKNSLMLILFLFNLKFCFFHALSILSHGQMVYHVLDVSAEEALQVVGGVADAMVGDAALREVVSTNFCTTVARGNQRLAAVGNIVNILLVLLVVDERIEAAQGALLVLGLVASFGAFYEDSSVSPVFGFFHM